MNTTHIPTTGNTLQVWVGVVPVGPKGTALNSSYNNRDSREYKEDLGYAVVNFARMVPDGLLVFFPSYGVLKSCTDFWKNTSVGGTGTASVKPFLRLVQATEHSANSLLCTSYVVSRHNPILLPCVCLLACMHVYMYACMYV